MSSASRLPPNALPSSMTLENNSAFRAFSAMTFSSIVSLAMWGPTAFRRT
jgi:hypothetical protein